METDDSAMNMSLTYLVSDEHQSAPLDSESETFSNNAMIWRCECGTINSFRSVYCSGNTCFLKRKTNMRDYEIAHELPKVESASWVCGRGLQNPPMRDICECNDTMPWSCVGKRYNRTANKLDEGWWICPGCQSINSLDSRSCNNTCSYARLYLYPFKLPTDELGHLWWCRNGHPTPIPRKDCQFCHTPFADPKSAEYIYMSDMEIIENSIVPVTNNGWKCPMCFRKNPRNAYACISGCSYLNHTVVMKFPSHETCLVLCQKCEKQNALFPCANSRSQSPVFCFACAASLADTSSEKFVCVSCRPRCKWCKDRTFLKMKDMRSGDFVPVCESCYEKIQILEHVGECTETGPSVECFASVPQECPFFADMTSIGLLNSLAAVETLLCQMAQQKLPKKEPKCDLCAITFHIGIARYNLGVCDMCRDKEVTVCSVCNFHISKVKKWPILCCGECSALNIDEHVMDDDESMVYDDESMVYDDRYSEYSQME